MPGDHFHPPLTIQSDSQCCSPACGTNFPTGCGDSWRICWTIDQTGAVGETFTRTCPSLANRALALRTEELQSKVGRKGLAFRDLMRLLEQAWKLLLAGLLRHGTFTRTWPLSVNGIRSSNIPKTILIGTFKLEYDGKACGRRSRLWDNLMSSSLYNAETILSREAWGPTPVDYLILF